MSEQSAVRQTPMRSFSRWAWTILKNLILWNSILKFVYELHSVQGAIKWVLAYLAQLSERLQWLFVSFISVVDRIVEVYSDALDRLFQWVPFHIPGAYHNAIVLGSIMLIPVLSAAGKTLRRNDLQHQLSAKLSDFNQMVSKWTDVTAALHGDVASAENASNSLIGTDGSVGPPRRSAVDRKFASRVFEIRKQTQDFRKKYSDETLRTVPFEELSDCLGSQA